MTVEVDITEASDNFGVSQEYMKEWLDSNSDIIESMVLDNILEMMLEGLGVRT